MPNAASSAAIHCAKIAVRVVLTAVRSVVPPAVKSAVKKVVEIVALAAVQKEKQIVILQTKRKINNLVLTKCFPSLKEELFRLQYRLYMATF